MIICNLKVKLAENNLKISKVFNDTGISRSTLTSLAENQTKGIQFNTLNTLCNYLKITPGELFSYAPIEITVNLDDVYIEKASHLYNKGTQDGYIGCCDFSATLYLNVQSSTEKFSTEFKASGRFRDTNLIMDIVLSPSPDNKFKEDVKFKALYDALPRELQTHVKDEIRNSFISSLCDVTRLDETYTPCRMHLEDIAINIILNFNHYKSNF